MKFLHCSDIHLGRRPVGGLGEFSQKRYEDYFNAFDFAIQVAIENNVRCFLVAGDLFDKKDLSPDILERAEILFKKLRNSGIIPIVIDGNHDCLIGAETDSWINYLHNTKLIERPFCYFSNGQLTCNTIKIDDVEFYGLGYQGAFINEALVYLSNYLNDKKHSKNVLLVHTAISDLDPLLPGTAKKESITLLKDKVIYIAAGHFHKYYHFPMDNPYFFVPGAPEHYDFGEKDYKKGFIIFDTDTKEQLFIPSKHRNCISVIFDIDSDNINDFYSAFYRNVDTLILNKNEDIVYCQINLSKSLLIDNDKCEEYLIQKGALKAIIRFVFPHEDDTFSIGKMLASVEQIECQIISKWNYFSEFADYTTKSLSKLKNYQEANNENLFIEEFDNLMNFIIKKQNAD